MIKATALRMKDGSVMTDAGEFTSECIIDCAGSYIGETRLKETLAAFLSKFHLKMGKLHGGYFPHELRSPTVGRLFLVGDSAGQCVPFWNVLRTDCAARVIERELTLEEGLLSTVCEIHRIYFKIAGWLQWLINAIPNFWATQLGKLWSIRSVSDCLLNQYLQEFENCLEAKPLRHFAS